MSSFSPRKRDAILAPPSSGAPATGAPAATTTTTIATSQRPARTKRSGPTTAAGNRSEEEDASEEDPSNSQGGAGTTTFLSALLGASAASGAAGATSGGEVVGADLQSSSIVISSRTWKTIRALYPSLPHHEQQELARMQERELAAAGLQEAARRRPARIRPANPLPSSVGSQSARGAKDSGPGVPPMSAAEADAFRHLLSTELLSSVPGGVADNQAMLLRRLRGFAARGVGRRSDAPVALLPVSTYSSGSQSSRRSGESGFTADGGVQVKAGRRQGQVVGGSGGAAQAQRAMAMSLGASSQMVPSSSDQKETADATPRSMSASMPPLAAVGALAASSSTTTAHHLSPRVLGTGLDVLVQPRARDTKSYHVLNASSSSASHAHGQQAPPPPQPLKEEVPSMREAEAENARRRLQAASPSAATATTTAAEEDDSRADLSISSLLDTAKGAPTALAARMGLSQLTLDPSDAIPPTGASKLRSVRERHPMVSDEYAWDAATGRFTVIGTQAEKAMRLRERKARQAEEERHAADQRKEKERADERQRLAARAQKAKEANESQVASTASLLMADGPAALPVEPLVKKSLRLPIIQKKKKAKESLTSPAAEGEPGALAVPISPSSAAAGVSIVPVGVGDSSFALPAAPFDPDAHELFVQVHLQHAWAPDEIERVEEEAREAQRRVRREQQSAHHTTPEGETQAAGSGGAGVPSSSSSSSLHDSSDPLPPPPPIHALTQSQSTAGAAAAIPTGASRGVAQASRDVYWREFFEMKGAGGGAQQAAEGKTSSTKEQLAGDANQMEADGTTAMMASSSPSTSSSSRAGPPAAAAAVVPLTAPLGGGHLVTSQSQFSAIAIDPLTQVRYEMRPASKREGGEGGSSGGGSGPRIDSAQLQATLETLFQFVVETERKLTAAAAIAATAAAAAAAAATAATMVGSPSSKGSRSGSLAGSPDQLQQPKRLRLARAAAGGSGATPTGSISGRLGGDASPATGGKGVVTKINLDSAIASGASGVRKGRGKRGSTIMPGTIGIVPQPQQPPQPQQQPNSTLKTPAGADTIQEEETKEGGDAGDTVASIGSGEGAPLSSLALSTAPPPPVVLDVIDGLTLDTAGVARAWVWKSLLLLYPRSPLVLAESARLSQIADAAERRRQALANAAIEWARLGVRRESKMMTQRSASGADAGNRAGSTRTSPMEGGGGSMIRQRFSVFQTLNSTSLDPSAASPWRTAKGASTSSPLPTQAVAEANAVQARVARETQQAQERAVRALAPTKLTKAQRGQLGAFLVHGLQLKRSSNDFASSSSSSSSVSPLRLAWNGDQAIARWMLEQIGESAPSSY